MFWGRRVLEVDTLKLTNFELFDYLRHDDVHKDVDSWIEPPTDNFETFMEYTSQIPHLIIVLRKFPPRVKTCLKCGFTSSSWIKI